MPKCKNCNAQISRLDKDICPFCGCLKPLEGVDNSTQDFTKAFEPLSEEAKGIKYKSKVVAAILAFVIGFLGGHSFYLGFKKVGLITFGVSAILIGGLGSLLFFTGAIANALAFLIPYFAIEACMIDVGVSFLIKHDITDARGEFLK